MWELSTETSQVALRGAPGRGQPAGTGPAPITYCLRSLGWCFSGTSAETRWSRRWGRLTGPGLGTWRTARHLVGPQGCGSRARQPGWPHGDVLRRWARSVLRQPSSSLCKKVAGTGPLRDSVSQYGSSCWVPLYPQMGWGPPLGLGGVRASLRCPGPGRSRHPAAQGWARST